MRLLLGVTGGIAAYKACEIASAAVKRGWAVRVAMTPNAARFVGPVTFEALTNHAVLLDDFALGAPDPGSSVRHVAWAKWATVACVAPLSASTLGRIACGLADDALTTTLLALPAAVPVVLCPAMNTEMWNHPIVQRNLRWLAEAGRYRVVAPAEKRLACGDVGVGGLAEVPDVLAALDALAAT
jgi:phosphopantothenoylcysteine decarboxylase/phosphopantothenate--cysteine ligase